MKYVIYSKVETQANDNEPMYWSNENGWGSLDGATVFDSENDILAFLSANPGAEKIALDRIVPRPVIIDLAMSIAGFRQGLEEGHLAWDPAHRCYRMSSDAQATFLEMFVLGALTPDPDIPAEDALKNHDVMNAPYEED